MPALFNIWFFKTNGTPTSGSVNLGQFVTPSPVNNLKRNEGAGDSFGDLQYIYAPLTFSADQDLADTSSWQPTWRPLANTGF